MAETEGIGIGEGPEIAPGPGRDRGLSADLHGISLIVFFSPGPGPGPGLEEDAIGPTLETETARGGVRGTRGHEEDGTGFRRENIDIHRIEVLQLYVLALRTTRFVLQINVFFYPRPSV